MKRLGQAIEKLRDLRQAKKELITGAFRARAYRGSWALCTAVGCRFWKGRCLLDFGRRILRGEFKVSEEEREQVRRFLDEATIDGCLLDQL